MRNPASAATITGDFYEVLAKAILGGEVIADDPFIVQPDLEIFEKETWVEVKSSHKWTDFKIMISQLEKYEALSESRFPFSKPKIKFLMFIHNVYRMVKTFKTDDALIRALCGNTAGAVLMPFSFLKLMLPNFSIYTWKHGVYRDNPFDYYLIPSWTFREMVAAPAFSISKFSGNGRFKYKREEVKGIVIDDTPVAPFELVEIK